MGCCNEKQDDQIEDINQEKLDRNLKQIQGIQLTIKQGEIIREPIKCLVLGTDQFCKNLTLVKESDSEFLNSFKLEYLSQENEEFLEKKIKVGELRYFPIDEKLNKKNKYNFEGIILIGIPVFRYNKQKEQTDILRKIFQDLFKFLKEKNIQSAGFGDFVNQLFGFPRQILAQIFAESINQYSKQKIQNDLDIIKIIIAMNDLSFIQLFKENIQQIAGDLKFEYNQAHSYYKNNQINSNIQQKSEKVDDQVQILRESKQNQNIISLQNQKQNSKINYQENDSEIQDTLTQSEIQQEEQDLRRKSLIQINEEEGN